MSPSSGKKLPSPAIKSLTYPKITIKVGSYFKSHPAYSNYIFGKVNESNK